MIIAIDFDGTCVTHEFPAIGKDVGAAPVLKRLVSSGHKLILFTMRSDIVDPEGEDSDLHLESGNYLSDAVGWFEKNEIELYGVQVNPEQHTWTTSPKAYAQLYIDDAAFGCPLITPPPMAGRPYVDWNMVERVLELNGVFAEEEVNNGHS